MDRSPEEAPSRGSVQEDVNMGTVSWILIAIFGFLFTAHIFLWAPRRLPTLQISPFGADPFGISILVAAVLYPSPFGMPTLLGIILVLLPFFFFLFLCNRKEEGGMSFRHLRLFNLAMLAKQSSKLGWSLLSKPDYLGARIIKARYHPTTNLMSAPLEEDIWRGIWKAMTILVYAFI